MKKIGIMMISFLLFVVGCGSDSATPTGTLTLMSITVTPTDIGILLNRTVQLKATGTFSDNSTRELLSTEVVWSSSDVTKATISGAGIATGAASSGTTTLKAASATATTTFGTTALAVQTTATVSIKSGSTVACEKAYTPANLFVPANTQVTWTNNDGGGHTVTSTGTPTSSVCPPGGNTIVGELNSNVAGGGTFSHTFALAGTFHYACAVGSHQMRATVIVEP